MTKQTLDGRGNKQESCAREIIPFTIRVGLVPILQLVRDGSILELEVLSATGICATGSSHTVLRGSRAAGIPISQFVRLHLIKRICSHVPELISVNKCGYTTCLHSAKRNYARLVNSAVALYASVLAHPMHDEDPRQAYQVAWRRYLVSSRADRRDNAHAFLTVV